MGVDGKLPDMTLMNKHFLLADRSLSDEYKEK